MSQAVQSWEDSLKGTSRQSQDQMRAVYQIVQQASSSNSSTSQSTKPAFDPATHHFSPDELKPTPIQRKSRKTLVREKDNPQLKEELLSVKEELQSLRETLLIAQQQSA